MSSDNIEIDDPEEVAKELQEMKNSLRTNAIQKLGEALNSPLEKGATPLKVEQPKDQLLIDFNDLSLNFVERSIKQILYSRSVEILEQLLFEAKQYQVESTKDKFVGASRFVVIKAIKNILGKLVEEHGAESKNDKEVCRSIRDQMLFLSNFLTGIIVIDDIKWMNYKGDIVFNNDLGNMIEIPEELHQYITNEVTNLGDIEECHDFMRKNTKICWFNYMTKEFVNEPGMGSQLMPNDLWELVSLGPIDENTHLDVLNVIGLSVEKPQESVDESQCQ